MNQVTTPSEEPNTPKTVLSGAVVRMKGKRFRYVRPDQVPKAVPLPVVRRPAKVARLLALAHHIQNAIDRGVVADCATAARQLGFTRAWLTQLLDLTLLTPEIQEAILELEVINGENMARAPKRRAEAPSVVVPLSQKLMGRAQASAKDAYQRGQRGPGACPRPSSGFSYGLVGRAVSSPTHIITSQGSIHDLSFSGSSSNRPRR